MKCLITKFCLWWLKRQQFTLDKSKLDHGSIWPLARPAYDPMEDEERIMKGEIESYFE